eukprot:14568257-Heterocapsa_arctica.AAC.1
MWEWWNYTSKTDKMRIGSWRTIIQLAIDQAEVNKSTKVKIPATVIDRAYAFIDINNDFTSRDNGLIEMDIQKAKRLFDLVKSETTAKGVFLNGIGQAPSPSGKPPKQHIFERFRTTIPKNTPPTMAPSGTETISLMKKTIWKGYIGPQGKIYGPPRRPPRSITS